MIPMAEAERIAQMHVLGKTKRQIARETGHGRRQVAKIIEESDQPAYVAKIRGQFIGLGDTAIAALKKEMERGNYELAKWFLEKTGAIADVEGRAFVAKMAGVSGTAPNAGEAPKQMLAAEARDLILASLSGPDRQIFRVLETFREKARAYGIPDVIDLPDHETPLNRYAKEEPPGANANGG